MRARTESDEANAVGGNEESSMSTFLGISYNYIVWKFI